MIWITIDKQTIQTQDAEYRVRKEDDRYVAYLTASDDDESYYWERLRRKSYATQIEAVAACDMHPLRMPPLGRGQIFRNCWPQWYVSCALPQCPTTLLISDSGCDGDYNEVTQRLLDMDWTRRSGRWYCTECVDGPEFVVIGIFDLGSHGLPDRRDVVAVKYSEKWSLHLMNVANNDTATRIYPKRYYTTLGWAKRAWQRWRAAYSKRH